MGLTAKQLFLEKFIRNYDANIARRKGKIEGMLARLPDGGEKNDLRAELQKAETQPDKKLAYRALKQVKLKASFSARRQPVLTRLNAVPTLRPKFEARLSAANELAKNRAFPDAGRELDALRTELETALSQYDPTDDVRRFGEALSTLKLHFDTATNLLVKFETFRTREGPPLLDACREPLANRIPDYDALSLPDWAEEVEALIAAEGAFVNEVEMKLEALQADAQRFKKLHEEMSQLDPLMQRASALCEAFPGNTLVAALFPLLDIEVLTVAQYGPFFETGRPGKLHPYQRLFGPAFGIFHQLKAAANARRSEVKRLGERRRARLEKQPAVYTQTTADELENERSKDAEALAKKQEVPERVVQPMAAFDAKPLFSVLEDRVRAAAQGRRRREEEAIALAELERHTRERLQAHILEKGYRKEADELFDLGLKSRNDFASEFIASQGWNAQALSARQKAIARAVGKGMFEGASQSLGNSIDPAAKTLRIRGQQYRDPHVLNNGGFGEIVRYQSEADPASFVVVKSLRDKDNGDRSDLHREIVNHYRLMKGAKDAPGGKNVVQMLGALSAPDGTLHMVMEMADGGDFEDNRMAMLIASNNGALPEGARNVLNQARLKQALEGMRFMRDQNMVHFDIKGANFMLAADGTVKVGDFGSAAVSAAPDGKVKPSARDNIGTAGYVPGFDRGDTVDSSYDAFALGKLFQSAHLNSRPPTGSGFGFGELPPEFENLTGALERITGAMTDPAAAKRPELETVLQSSYIRNLENYDAEAVDELSKTAVAYSNALNKEVQTVRPKLPDEDLEKIARIFRKTKDSVSSGNIILIYQQEIQAAEKETADLRERLASPRADEQQRKQIENEVEERQGLVKTKKALLGLFGKSEEAKVLAAKMRQVADRLMYPGSHPFGGARETSSFEASLRALKERTESARALVSAEPGPDMLKLTEARAALARDIATLEDALAVFSSAPPTREVQTTDSDDSDPSRIAVRSGLVARAKALELVQKLDESIHTLIKQQTQSRAWDDVEKTVLDLADSLSLTAKQGLEKALEAHRLLSAEDGQGLGVSRRVDTHAVREKLADCMVCRSELVKGCQKLAREIDQAEQALKRPNEDLGSTEYKRREAAVEAARRNHDLAEASQKEMDAAIGRLREWG